MPRKCGECSACCTVLAVPELTKPTLTRCEYDKKVGRNRCSCYATRPSSCAAYRCGWLDGLGTTKDRPDRIGWIVDAVALVSSVILVFREVGGGDRAQAEHLQAACARRRAICLQYMDGRRRIISDSTQASLDVMLSFPAGP